MDGTPPPDAEPGPPDSSVLVNPVEFRPPGPETGVVVDVTNVLGNPVALDMDSVELTI
jgi:hypothetical protein